MIRLERVGKRFGDSWVFRELDLHVARGESVAIVGPSGGGKSVLLKIIAGLYAPDAGTIAVSTEDKGMLFQKNALFDSFTVVENLLFPLRERKRMEGAEAMKRAKGFLEAVGLSGNENLYPDEISGGMQKRLGIARALIVEPELILYDEPTAGLDPITSRKIADLIRDLRSKLGSTVVTVTNDMQRAYQIGDRIHLLAQGRLSAGGTPDATKNSKDAAVRQFIFGLKDGPLTSGLE
ncbi:MAG: ATP-binding cassette domain-containing protein [Bdellovibrionales bacterium]|nr:ATP-binding cassette domain-containing protein [Bdellovibrionales bacterium]